tara:strand:+ start:2390 stop:4915 length:2526 start_codon:yes stop_codon:yes gene_type:complete
MPTQWTTFPMEFKGGLISNLTPLQQGINAVGSATILQNFESDREGGYSKLKGYSKFSETKVPGGGEVLAMKVVSSGRVVTARKMDTATITEYQTATSTVNGAVSNSTAVSLDNNTATAVVNGAVTNGTTVAVDRVRTFTGVTGATSLAGASATFDITNTNGTYTAAINAAGTGFKVNETVTVLGANLGGATAANNATVTVTSVGSSAVTYTNPTQSGYSGSGSSATFNITKTGTTYTVAITAAGSGFSASETITIVGTQLNGATTANDATITITTVDGSGGITAATIAGTGLAEGPVTGVSVAGTGAAFGTITKGMIVTGTGISGEVTVKTVTSQTSIILDTAVSLADDAVLSFITNIKSGMFVTGTGISGTVKVASLTNQNSIVLDSAQSISDNTVLTFGTFHSTQLNKTLYFHGTGTDWTHIGTSSSTNTLKCRFASFNFTQEDKTIFVDSKSFPIIYNASGNTTVSLTSSNSSDVQGAENVVVFKNHAFYSKGSKIFFTAPNTVDDFATGNGAGTINVGHDVTGMIGFREQLIIFTTDTIKKLVGSTSSDFKLEPITDRIGCINPDSIQEFGGDVAYLSPDGIRLLSATDRIGDLALDIASDPIYKDANEFISQTDVFCSVLVRGKSQYRLFAYIPSVQAASASGLIATKFIAQGGSGIAWSTTKGLKVNVADSTYSGATETIMFGNDDGFCYRMDSGNSFDGSAIESIYESPFMPITDPQIRKTMYKLTLYANPTGTMNVDVNFKIDFDAGNDPSVIQPPAITVSSAAAGGGISLFGASTSVYGGSGVTYGGVLDKIYKQNLVGSFKTVAMRITDNSTNPTFTLDTAVLEYRQHDRQ